MPRTLEHRQILAAVRSLGDARIVSLETSIGNLLSPLEETLARSGVPADAQFHILCCDEYFLVTSVVARAGLVEVERLAQEIRTAIERAQ